MQFSTLIESTIGISSLVMAFSLGYVTKETKQVTKVIAKDEYCFPMANDAESRSFWAKSDKTLVDIYKNPQELMDTQGWGHNLPNVNILRFDETGIICLEYSNKKLDCIGQMSISER